MRRSFLAAAAVVAALLAFVLLPGVREYLTQHPPQRLADLAPLAGKLLHAVRYSHLGRFVAVIAIIGFVRWLVIWMPTSPPWVEALMAVALSVVGAVLNAWVAHEAITLPLVEQAVFAGAESAFGLLLIRRKNARETDVGTDGRAKWVGGNLAVK